MIKKIAILLLVGMFFSGSVFAGGSIFSGSKRRQSNPNGVDMIGIHICANLRCPKMGIMDGSCNQLPNSSRYYGVCICNLGYALKDGQCVIDTGANCNTIASCEDGYFCNFGGEGSPNACQKVRAESLEQNGRRYYYNREEDLSSWCRSTSEGKNCKYGYLTYYAAYDWCLSLGGRLLNSKEVEGLPSEWLGRLPWNGNLAAYWLSDGRLSATGEVLALGDTTGWEATGGVVCVKDTNDAQVDSEGNSGARWLGIEGCDCDTDKGVSYDTSDNLCNIQCCRDKYGEEGFYNAGVCCSNINNDDCVCGAICAGGSCTHGDYARLLGGYCQAKLEGLI